MEITARGFVFVVVLGLLAVAPVRAQTGGAADTVKAAVADTAKAAVADPVKPTPAATPTGMPELTPSQMEAPDIIRASVEALDWKRQAAMVKGDVAELKKIFVENLTYTHSMGISQSRKQLFDMLASGSVSYNKFDTQNAKWDIYPGTVIGTGSQTIDLTIEGRPVVTRNRYTVVYVKFGDQWRCVAYQSTTLPSVSETQTIR